MLLLTAIPCFFITQATSYLPLLVLAFLVGFAGNLFSVGIAWNAAWFPKDRQGFALGVFGAGNVGASVTKLLVVLLPTIIASTAGATYFGVFPGGWRIFPAFYTVAARRRRGPDLRHRPRATTASGGEGKPMREMLAPLQARAGVAVQPLLRGGLRGLRRARRLAPQVLRRQLRRPAAEAALLTATFIFPASLLRPVGGWFSDRFGARRVMYWTFGVMVVTTGILMMPNGHLVIAHADGAQSEHLGYSMALRAVRPARLRARLRHGRRQGRRLQAHPRVLPRQRRLGRRAWSGCSVASAASSSRRCSPTPRSGPASRRPPSSSSSCSPRPASPGCTGPSCTCCTTSRPTSPATSSPRPPLRGRPLTPTPAATGPPRRDQP